MRDGGDRRGHSHDRVMLALPAVLVIVSSFTRGDTMKFAPTGVSLRWYQKAWENELFMMALRTSTYIAVLVAIVALVILPPRLRSIAVDFSGKAFGRASERSKVIGACDL